MQESDYLIIGAGIIGMAIARALHRRYPSASITVLEKEADVAYHSSGRNSGVLHSGFYYTADSLKAKFTREGNAFMRNYCHEHGLHINLCQKVVVAQNDSELPALYELEKRGKANGVDIRLIDQQELTAIDPNVKTCQKALFSPTTATVDPVEVNQCMRKGLEAEGVKFFFGQKYQKHLGENRIKTQSGDVFVGKMLINAAGLYADKIAKDFGFSKHYTIIPFKGIYLKYKGTDHPIRTNVYPVPNLKNPFLGVHYTLTVDGTTKIGPTSIPAFWRENYKGWKNFRLGELSQILCWEARLFLLNAFGFRTLAFEEMKKYNKRYFRGLATKMLHHIDGEKFTQWSKPGIRAQLLNTQSKELVMDFVVEGDAKSVHVLNAVSPAFTASVPFGEWVVEKYISQIQKV